LPFILLYFTNLALKYFRPARALGSQELGLILCMGFIGSAFPTKNVAGRLVAVLATPYYKATPENRWGDYVLDHLKPWAVPSNQTGAITHLWEGLPRGQSLPWDVWLMPLFWWFTLLAALFIACFCITVILRKQWVEYERIVFPLARLPVMMITDETEGSPWPGFFRSRMFWFGLSIGLFILTWNVLPRFSHRIPIIPLGPTHSTSLTLGPDFPPLIVKFNYVVAAFGYLTNLEVLLSIWFFHLLSLLEIGAINRLGLTVSSEYFGGVLLQQVGGFVALALFGLYMARSHILAVIRLAIRPTGEDRDEMLSYRTAVIGFVLSLGYAGAWLHALGVSLQGVVIQLALLFIYFLGLAKIVAETGLVYIETPQRTQSLVAGILGSTIQTPDHTALALASNSVESHRQYMLPAFVHIGKTNDQFRWGRSRIVLALAAAFILGFAASVAYTLDLCYGATGAANILHVYVFGGYGLTMFNRVVRWTSSVPSFTGTDLGFISAGVLGTLALSLLRLRFTWWPLHPVGFTVGYVYPVRVTAFTVFLTWAFKSLVLRIGGITLYRNLQPFFLGLLIGYTLGVGVSTLTDAIWFPGNGKMVHTW